MTVICTVTYIKNKLPTHEDTTVDCMTHPSGHLIVQELQADENLTLIKKTRPWKDIRYHAKSCYSKRALGGDAAKVTRHESDPMFWESDLPPLWKGRKIKYSRTETKNPNGSINHSFYNKLAKVALRERMKQEAMKELKKSNCWTSD